VVIHFPHRTAFVAKRKNTIEENEGKKRGNYKCGRVSSSQRRPSPFYHHATLTSESFFLLKCGALSKVGHDCAYEPKYRYIKVGDETEKNNAKVQVTGMSYVGRFNFISKVSLRVHVLTHFLPPNSKTDEIFSLDCDNSAKVLYAKK
jgi:hypothetical protein